MIDLGTTDFTLGIDGLSSQELEEYSTRLFDEWDQFLAMELRLPDYAVGLEIDEGSIKGRGRILATGAALYAGVAGYGSFVQGVQAIAATVRTGGAILVDSAAKPFPIPDALKFHRRTPGFPGRIERLLAMVQRGELTPEEGAAEVMKMLVDEPEVPSEFRRAITDSFHTIFIEPQQLSLAFENSDADSPYAPEPPKPRKPRQPTDLPPTERFRVEVWKDSKNGARRVLTVIV